jgi:hypothetical protein
LAVITELSNASEEMLHLRRWMTLTDKRAEQLLMRWLSPRQLEQYQTWGLFEAKRGKTHYAVCQGQVYELAEPLSSFSQRPVAALCMVSVDIATVCYPWPDRMLAKKIAIETYTQWQWYRAQTRLAIL